MSLQASTDVLETIDAALRPGQRSVPRPARAQHHRLRAAGRRSRLRDTGERGRKIRAYRAAHAVDLGGVRFAIGRSEDVLPTLSLRDLDVALIDGGHGFPTPFVDWCYMAQPLRVGGLLVIDDIHLWTGRVLRDFLREEPGWTMRAEFPMRAVVFEKTAPMPALPEWFAQPFVRRRSSRRDADTRWSGAWRGSARR